MNEKKELDIVSTMRKRAESIVVSIINDIRINPAVAAEWDAMASEIIIALKNKWVKKISEELENADYFRTENNCDHDFQGLFRYRKSNRDWIVDEFEACSKCHLVIANNEMGQYTPMFQFYSKAYYLEGHLYYRHEHTPKADDLILDEEEDA